MITEIRLTQQEIANRVGASREMVARIMKDLEVGGYISKQGKRIIINERLPDSY
jgi:CRP/FNR family cyclic AMP-dependent transcriptional regulator